MNLYEIVSNLQKIALSQPNIRTAKNGSIYSIMNSNPAIKYGVFVVTQTNHSSDINTDTYGFTLFAVDRLDDTLENNRLSIQSICKEQLENIVKIFCDTFELDVPNINYTPFTQKFIDETAGVYANVEIQLYGSSCYDNGVISRPGIKFLQEEKSVLITENNSTTAILPDEGYDGMEKVIVDVCVDLSDYYTKSETDSKIKESSDENKAYTDEKIEEVGNSINEETERAREAENRLSEDISNETERATEKEGELQQSITNIENNITNNYYSKDEIDSVIDEKIEEKLDEGAIGEKIDSIIDEKLDDKIDDKVDSVIDEKLTGYATEQWVEDKHYLTEHQSLEDYYTKEEVDAKIDDVEVDLSDYYTKEEIEDKHYLTEHQSLEDYYTKEEIDDKSFATFADLSDYYTKSEIDEKGYVTSDELSDYADKAYVDQAVEDAIEDIPTSFKTINGESIIGEGNIEITSEGSITVDGELSETSENPVQNKVITNKLNELEGEFEGVTDRLDEIDEKVVNIPDDIASQDDIQSAIDGQQFKTINGQSIKGSGNIQIEGGSTDLSNYYTKSEVDSNINSKISEQQFKTINGQSIKGTGNIEVSAKIDVDSEMSDTSTNPVENQAIKKYIDSKISGLDNFFVECVDGSLTTISADMWYGRAAEQIRDYAFYNYTSINSAYIPEIKRLGDHAFEGCSSLNEIHCTGKAGAVGTDAFKGVAEVGTLYYPDGEDYSEWCNALPEGWSCVIEGAYLNLGQYSIDVPSEGSSTRITVESSSDWHIDSNPDWCEISTESDAFTVTIEESDDARNGEIVVYNEDGLSKSVSVYQKAKSIPYDEVHYTTDSGYALPLGSETWGKANVVSNEYYGNYGIIKFDTTLTEVANKAMSSARLTSVKLPDTVVTIRLGAFQNSSITSFTVPRDCERIDVSAFERCYNLEYIYMNEKLKTIGASAFERCGLKEINFPETLETIDFRAFVNTPIETFFIPKSVKAIWANGITGNYPESKNWIFEEGTTVIGAWGQEINSPESFIFPNSLEFLGDPNRYFEDNLFYNAQFDTIDLRNTKVSRINAVFSKGSLSMYNYNITKVYLPSTLNELATYAFNGLNNEHIDFYIYALIPPKILEEGGYYTSLVSNVFYENGKNITFHVHPSSDYSTWQRSMPDATIVYDLID